MKLHLLLLLFLNCSCINYYAHLFIKLFLRGMHVCMNVCMYVYTVMHASENFKFGTQNICKNIWEHVFHRRRTLTLSLEAFDSALERRCAHSLNNRLFKKKIRSSNHYSSLTNIKHCAINRLIFITASHTVVLIVSKITSYLGCYQVGCYQALNPCQAKSFILIQRSKIRSKHYHPPLPSPHQG